MPEAFSNILRRPLRTGLTILGIVIGVFALTVMGALAEKLNVLVEGGDEYFRTRIFVFEEDARSGFQASYRPISRDLVERIEEVKGVERASPVLQVLFNLIIIGASVIAVIVGGLSVINTMVMTVSERVREIGIKKAVGARTGAILREFLAEATLLGAIGGVIGLAAGALLVLVLNAQTAGSGTSVFLLTPMLLARSFVFATVLGAAAGIYP